MWQSSFELDQLSCEGKTDRKKLKSNENEDEEDDIDMSKGEDVERYVNDKEGIKLNNFIFNLSLLYTIYTKIHIMLAKH